MGYETSGEVGHDLERSERAKGAEYVAEKGRDRERHLGRTTSKCKSRPGLPGLLFI